MKSGRSSSPKAPSIVNPPGMSPQEVDALFFDHADDARVAKSIARLRQEDISEAIAFSVRATTAFPLSPQVLTSAGVVRLTNNDYEMAETYLLRAAELAPSDGYPLKCLGEVNLRRKNFRAADDYFEKALVLNPGDEIAALMLGRSKIAQGDYDGAAEPFQRLLSINPRSAFAYYGFAQMEFDAGNFKGAESMLNHIFEIDPSDIYALCSLGRIALLRGSPGQAQELFEAAKDVGRNSSLANNALGMMYAHHGLVLRALKCYEVVLSRHQDEPFARIGLIDANIRRGRYGDAMKNIESAERAEEVTSLAKVYRGVLALKRNDYSGACDAAVESLAQKFSVAALFILAAAAKRDPSLANVPAILAMSAEHFPKESEKIAQVSRFYDGDDYNSKLLDDAVEEFFISSLFESHFLRRPIPRSKREQKPQL